MRLGLFSTLSGSGSRRLVQAVSRACAGGDVADTTVAFLAVNRVLGESEETDASVAAIMAEFDYPVVRESAVRFRGAERKAARAALAAGDAGPMNAWRDAFNDLLRPRLGPTDLDLLLGDMWIWGPRLCAERRGLNLHPALPTGPLGGIWYEAIWDLIEADARESGVMLHRVSPEVDRGPVVSYTRYSLRDGAMGGLWDTLPAGGAEREALIRSQRALKRAATHPLFLAIRAAGVDREVPLLLHTIRAVAEGRIRFTDGGVETGSATAAGRPSSNGATDRGNAGSGGLDLTKEVESSLRSG